MAILNALKIATNLMAVTTVSAASATSSYIYGTQASNKNHYLFANGKLSKLNSQSFPQNQTPKFRTSEQASASILAQSQYTTKEKEHIKTLLKEIDFAPNNAGKNALIKNLRNINDITKSYFKVKSDSSNKSEFKQLDKNSIVEARLDSKEILKAYLPDLSSKDINQLHELIDKDVHINLLALKDGKIGVYVTGFKMEDSNDTWDIITTILGFVGKNESLENIVDILKKSNKVSYVLGVSFGAQRASNISNSSNPELSVFLDPLQFNPAQLQKLFKNSDSMQKALGIYPYFAQNFNTLVKNITEYINPAITSPYPLLGLEVFAEEQSSSGLLGKAFGEFHGIPSLNMPYIAAIERFINYLDKVNLD